MGKGREVMAEAKKLCGQLRGKDGLDQLEAEIERDFDWFFTALQKEKKHALESLVQGIGKIPQQERNTIESYVSVSETAMIAAERISYFHNRFQQGLEARLGGSLCQRLRRSDDPNKLPALKRNEPDQEHKTEGENGRDE